LLFPPIFVGLNPPVRSGRWRRIGVLPVEDFTFPKFRSSTWLQPGIVTDWKIWDGESYEDAGVLPESLRSLEILVVHAYQDVEKRILTGRSWLAEGADFGVWNESA
jgi:hypothetical protein